MKTLFSILMDDPNWRRVSWRDHESAAQYVGNNPELLQKRIYEAHTCLVDRYRDLPIVLFDPANKRLILAGGYYLQWQTRLEPDQPESYENQQTNTGCVVLMHAE